MNSLEMEGKTVEEAVAAACEKLGVKEEEVTFEILQEPKAGLLGMMTRKARVLVTPRAEEAAPAPVVKPAFAEDDEEDDRVYRESSARPALDPNFDPVAALQTICRAIDPGAEVIATHEADRLVLCVNCNGSGIFIGHRGQTLDSLQYLINRMAGKQNPKIGRIVVDSEKYRERKAARLVDDAWAMAQAVKRNGRPVVSEPLSAFDRRIIHTTLREDHRVMTRSLGEGEFKRVQVLLNNQR